MVPTPPALDSIRLPLEAAFRLWTRRLRATFVLALAPSLAMLVPWLWLPPSDSIEGIAYAIIEWAESAGTWRMFAIAGAISAYCSAALIHCQATGAGLVDGLAAAMRRLPSVLIAAALYAGWMAACCAPLVTALWWSPWASTETMQWMLIGVGTMLTLVLLCWFSLALALCLHAVMLERRDPLTALWRSARLIHGHWWRTSVVVSVPVFVHMAAVGACSVPALGIASSAAAALYGPEGLLEARWLLAGHALLAPVNAVFVPLIFAGLQAMYDDLAARSTPSRAPLR